jgi:hypothetical protein
LATAIAKSVIMAYDRRALEPRDQPMRSGMADPA